MADGSPVKINAENFMNLDFPDGDEEMEGTDRDKKDEKHERDK